jgi:hypothetical protein
MKKGLKMYGDRGEAAVEEELQQLHDQKVMEPVAADSLTYAEKKKALEYLMFLKEKRTGKIKGRGCADGRKQWVYTAKEEASSPTVLIESIMLTSVIDALEGRHVVTANIPGAFMQADMDKVVHMQRRAAAEDRSGVRAVRRDRRGPTGPVRAAAQGAVWYDARRAIVLAQTHLQIAGVGIRD